MPAGFESSIALVLAALVGNRDSSSGRGTCSEFYWFFLGRKKWEKFHYKNHTSYSKCFASVLLFVYYVYMCVCFMLRKISNNTISTGFFLWLNCFLLKFLVTAFLFFFLVRFLFFFIKSFVSCWFLPFRIILVLLSESSSFFSGLLGLFYVLNTYVLDFFTFCIFCTFFDFLLCFFLSFYSFLFEFSQEFCCFVFFFFVLWILL